ncbi:MAG TPA: DNA repair protein RecN [Melioribacteraceae bacterium]|nr:DNA repair protein RecN [Melioribacteraceae bacterium]
MLKSLYIKDYALIESISVEFERGLNIITGETGAGKSILIDAMGILLGERASFEVIRRDANKSVIEGIFDIKDNKKVFDVLNDYDIEYSEELIIRREISAKGTNRIFLNDSPINLNLLKEIGYYLVDLHGQHEHQSLLRNEKHIDFLDEYINVDEIKEKYRAIISSISKLKNELEQMTLKESIAKEKFELYNFQLKEINEVNPLLGEEELLISELKILENSEKLSELNSSIFVLLYDSENSVYDNLSMVRNYLNELAKIDPRYNEKINDCESILAMVQEISDFSRSYLNKVELDPNKLEEIRARLNSFMRLKKKYGGSIEAVLNYKEKIKEEVELVSNFGEKINELNRKLNQLRIEAGVLAKNLNYKRVKGSLNLKTEIEDTLKELGINYSNFEVTINNKSANGSDRYIIIDNENYIYNNNGYDEVEFFISTNMGELPKPLTKVASGGEISRIMLALKTSMAKKESLPLLIFDEIDTGVSGRIGQKVGLALKKLSEYHQIIAITHLPQIAALAKAHYSVEKNIVDNRVVSIVKKLDDNERLNEVAKLLSGAEISETALLTAKELISYGK